jgi:ethanolamine ammonia-lyase large subunit
MDSLMTLLGVAGVNFLIAVPGADDIMLNYQSLSFHDVLGLRHLLNLRPAPEFTDWLSRMALLDGHGRLAPPSPANALVRGLLA